MKKTDMILPELFQRLIWVPLRLFMGIYCSLDIKGAHNIANLKGNMIIASNHQSELDPLLIVSCLPFFSRQFPIIYVTREKKLYDNPNRSKWKRIIYGSAFFKIIGGYPSYAGLKNYNQSLLHHIESLHLGNNVGIFPMGGIVKKDKIVKAKGGVSFLAQQSNAPIIPVLIEGLENLSMNNAFSKNMHVKVTFGNPLYLKDFVQNPHMMVINDIKNDYEIAAAYIWKQIERLRNSKN